MKIKYVLALMVIILLNITISSAKCSTISSITIELYPTNGDITTDITIKVRGVPFSGGYVTRAGASEYPVLYITYDDQIIASRLSPVTSYGGYGDYSGYSASWDTVIKVPNEYPYSELGQHIVKARVEASDGTFAIASTNFKVVNYLPPPQWWQDLPTDLLKQITGPTGLKGATGTQGVQGADGAPGKDAPVELLYASLGVSIVALIIAVIAFSKSRQNY